MDRVFVRGLAAETIVGIHAWEQETRRTVLIDIDLAIDAGAAAASDRVEATVSYSEVSRRVIEFLSTSRVHLIETLAVRLADLLFKDFAAGWLRIEVQKPGAVSTADAVGVVIERTKPAPGPGGVS